MTEEVFVIPTSFAQQRLWFLDQLEPGTASLNMSAALRLTGRLDAEALERSLNEVVRRHEALRTTFAGVDGEPVQVISSSLALALPVIELESAGAVEREAELEFLIQEEAQKPFNLMEGPLLRTTLVRVSPGEHVLLLSMHHIISDGWSAGVLVKELMSLYAAFVAGERPALAELPIQYADFALWQRERLQGDVLRASVGYWKRQLAGELPVLQLPTDRPRPAVQTYKGARESLRLPQHLAESLKRLGNHESATLFMILLAAFKTLLFRYTRQADIIVGMPIAGRNRAGVENLIGFFINTLVLRTDLSDNPTFRELLGRVREVTLDAYAHQELPFEKLLEELQPERDLSRTPLFQVYFNMLNFPDTEIELPGLTVKLLLPPEVESKFDLTMYIKEARDGIELQLVYNADLFARERTLEMLEQFAHLLEQIAETPESRLDEFSLITPSARRFLPDPAATLNNDWLGSVPALFAAQARRVPENLAVADKHEAWNYRDLDARSNQLAQYLRAHGIERGDAVAIYAHRSAPLVCALLGVMKAGAAFIILDPAYPASRHIACLDLAKPRGWLQMEAAGKLPDALEEYLAASPPLCRLSLPGRAQADAQQWLSEFSADDPQVSLCADDIAYVAFTSGSTGVPKGVLGRHGSLSHFIPWLRQTFGLAEADRFSLLSGIAHDPLHRDVFTPLQLGASICIPDPDDINVPGRVGEWMRRERISIAHLTPAMGQLITESAPDEPFNEVPSLRYVFLVGDVLTKHDVARLRRLAPAVTCVNYYGSTETQRAVSYFVVPVEPLSSRETGLEQGKEILPLGRGIDDVQLLVLNAGGRLAGVGEAGEIFLRSPHLAQGYLGDEALTGERFIPNPFTGREGDHLYRTGDLGRYLPDGVVEPLGRADQQVKIRGFRVELGEIEAVLGKHPSVSEAVVVVREDAAQNKHLVGYIVAHEGARSAMAHESRRAASSDFRLYLQARLPDYMIPSAFVMLDALPLTPNGKVNRQALPAPAFAAELEADAVAPRNPVEEVLASIWSAVLGLESLSVHDNFFALGGHSLLATQVIARVRAAFHVELPLRRLFELPTIAGMAGSIETAMKACDRLPVPPLAPTARGKDLPLSFAQQRLWFLDQLEPGNAFYNVGAAVRLTGRLNVAALSAGLAEVVRRHETLRTTFAEMDGQPRQVIAATLDVPLVIEELGALPAWEREPEVRRRATLELQRPFELARGPLLRLKLLRLGDDEHVALVTMHHIVSDGWSSGVLIKEMATLYQSFNAAAPSPLPELRLQYADYAAWQREWLRGEVLEQELHYWTKQLSGAPAVLELPSDRPRPSVVSFRGAKRHFVIRDTLSAALKELSQRESATLFMTLLAAFNVLLHRYMQQADIVVGTPIAGRGHAETEGLIGFFVNTLVLRTDLSANPSFRRLLSRVREVTLGAYAHQDVPFEMLVERLQPARSLSHAPLFQVALTLQNAPAAALEAHDLVISPLEVESGTAKFDLLLTLQDTEQGLRAFFEYSTDLFDAATIERMSAHFLNLLEGIVADPEESIAELPLLAATEQAQLLHEWNDAGTRFTPRLCLHQLFEAQAARTPDRVALTFEQEQLTYAQLNARANRLARYLRRAGVKPETLVGIYLEPSVEMVLGILGILKAGGAYVPLNPSHPRERLAFVLEDARIEVALTVEKLAGELPQAAGVRVLLDANRKAIAEESDENLEHRTTPDNLAYVIYTSGSTGEPKGVQVTHANVARLFDATEAWFSFDERDVWTLFHSYAFDFSVWELWGALLYGGRLVVVSYWVSRSPEAFFELVCGERVTVLNQTPSAFRQFIQTALAASTDLQPQLRAVIFGGEALELKSLKPWVERFGDAQPQLVNMYGITETTVHVTYQRLTAEHILSAPGSLIGRPIPDLQVYVLDGLLQLLPVGVPGEMYVGGDGLARGYLNRPELNAERFIVNPFSAQSGARLYRTGDFARYRADGVLEYLGRIDHQVKVRGFRIELGEIEAALVTHAAIDGAVVMAVNEASGTKSLVAYLVASAESEPSVSELHGFLKDKLPEYMIPHSFIMLDCLPLTTNGKVDRQALLTLDRTRAGAIGGFVAAQTSLEQSLAKIWSEVLGLEKIGVHDNFFELGGDSILSIQIVSRARQAGLQLTPKHLFQHQTIAELTSVVADAVNDTNAQPEAVSGTVPLTPIQQWFFEQNFSEPQHYNQALLLQTDSPLEHALLEPAVRHLLAHHDALRLRFQRAASGWQQIIAAPDETEAVYASSPLVTNIDLSALPEAAQALEVERATSAAQSGLELSSGRMICVLLFNFGAGKPSRLFIVIHHLAIDGVSWRILLEDLQTVYEQLRRGEPVKLPAKTTSFKRWAERLREHAQTDGLACEQDYWLSEPRVKTSRLPVAVEGSTPPTHASARDLTVRLDEAATLELLRDVPSAYRTQINDALLTALVTTLGKLGGAQALLIDLEGHGREELLDGADTSRTVGWFTTQFPVLLDTSAAASPVEALKMVKEQLRAVPQRGIGYGLLRYMREDAGTAQRLRERKQAEVRFNYLGQFDQLLDGTGFAVAPESYGATVSPQAAMSHLLDINSRIINSQLEVSWKYSEHTFPRETIEELAASYLDELRGLIRHCRASERNGYTPSDFPLAKIEQSPLDRLAAAYGPLEDLYPLSPLQEGLLFHALQAQGTDIYFIHLSCHFEGELDAEAFARAWQEVVRRHTILRTGFVWEDLAEPLQVVRQEAEVSWEQADWRAFSAPEQQTRFESYLAENRARGFDLREAPLMRLALFQLAANSHRFVWSSHHIVLDGWSHPVIIKEVLTLYDALRQGQPPQLPPPRPYHDYIAWLQRQDMHAAQAYWRKTLAGFNAPTTIGKGQPHAVAQQTHAIEKIRLADAAAQGLRDFARQHQLTLNTLVQGAWALLLSGADGAAAADVVFGVVVAGRPGELEGAEAMVGLLINTLPLRVQVSDDDELLSWLKQIQARQVEAQSYDYSPLIEVQKWSDVPRGQPLFESFITFLNYPVHNAVAEWDGPLEVRDLEFVERVNYALNLIASARGHFELELKYDTRRFDAAAVKRMLTVLEKLLEEFAAQPRSGVKRLRQLVADADRQQQAIKQQGFNEARRRLLENAKHKGAKKMSNREGDLKR
jgi:amino acid adenylation domain-containing protein/non-ribosomal peptide synthase protein (TIGR01720 family)